MSKHSGRIRNNPPMPGPLLGRAWLLQRILLMTIALLLMPVIAACSLYTIRPINAASSSSQSNQFDQQFDPTTFANSIWASKVVPTVMHKSVDIRIVLTALGKNSDAAQKQYAVESSDGFYNFMVKGQGKVLAVNTSSRNGTLRVQLPGYNGSSTILLQVGPVMLGTSLRDSVGFINFNQFTNQVQYQQVADALNAHASQSLQGTNFASLQGKMITFYGAFTFTDLQQIMITPVKITPQGAND
jgi:predicted lipoprotein